MTNNELRSVAIQAARYFIGHHTLLADDVVREAWRVDDVVIRNNTDCPVVSVVLKYVTGDDKMKFSIQLEGDNGEHVLVRYNGNAVYTQQEAVYRWRRSDLVTRNGGTQGCLTKEEHRLTEKYNDLHSST